MWLIPRREYLKRFRLGRTVLEQTAGLQLVVLADVFNPVAFRTGEYFARVLRGADLRGGPDESRFALDLGTGSGILALTAAQQGFDVDAVDLNPEAVRCAGINAAINNLDDRVRVHHGDLFAPVEAKQFDLITFSPPSFRGTPRSDFELSWRGEDVFERFAAALPDALKPGGVALVLQTSHGDERGLLEALDTSGLEIDLFARKHFGVEYLSVYRARRPF